MGDPEPTIVSDCKIPVVLRGAFRFSQSNRNRSPAEGPLRSGIATSLWPHSHQQRQLPPLPLTIHVLKPNLPQPPKLRLNIQQLIRRILGLNRESDPQQEFLVQPLGRG